VWLKELTPPNRECLQKLTVAELLLWNLKIHYHVHIPPLCHMASQLNPSHTLPSHSCKMRFNPPKWSLSFSFHTEIFMPFAFLSRMYMSLQLSRFDHPNKLWRSRGSSVSIETRAMGWTTGIQVQAGKMGFFFATASRPDLGPTQPPIQWLPRALPSGSKAARAWSWPLTSV
jgi:hypothetical protein